ncbi:MAG TPA: RagB/SusD family nutrient uptake outer membrane protein, partial [Longimicrobiales bacterium]|nr:RagB/SusD family nutrient uptake outer membrane protein [Longimicrobiales bacterium]
VMGDTAARSLLMARVVAVEAWANLYMGMFNCESPKEPNGAIVSALDIIKQSIPLFTKAADIARAAGSPNHERWAIAGRARAGLFSGGLDAALADARLIPDNFVYAAKFNATTSSNQITAFAHRSRLKAAGLDQHHWSKVDTIAGFVRDPYSGQLDKRLAITHGPNERGADGVTQYYNQEKYQDVGDDMNQVSGWEMRLIEAEVHMRKGELAQAVTMINRVRANAGLNPVTATTLEKVREHLLWERFSQLFLEGMRMYDLTRFGLVRDVLGPDRPMQYPLDGGEITLNPNTKGSLVGRCFPMS